MICQEICRDSNIRSYSCRRVCPIWVWMWLRREGPVEYSLCHLKKSLLNSCTVYAFLRRTKESVGQRFFHIQISLCKVKWVLGDARCRFIGIPAYTVLSQKYAWFDAQKVNILVLDCNQIERRGLSRTFIIHRHIPANLLDQIIKEIGKTCLHNAVTSVASILSRVSGRAVYWSLINPSKPDCS